MTQQGLRQASARNLSGFATEANYNEDFLRLFDAQGVPAGTFNERQLMWINARMGASYTNLNDSMQAYATSQGVYNWSSLGSLEDVADFTLAMPFGATYTRTGDATGLTASGTIQSFAADAPQRTDRGLALEPARTNLALRSQEFDNAAWSLTRATIVADATTAPDGTTTADKLVEDASASTSHLLLSSANITIVTATAYSTVIMAKASERSWIQLQEGTGVTASAYFNLSGSGAVGTVAGTGSPSASILALTDGWFLCSLLWTSVSTAARIRAYLASGNGGVSYSGDGASGAFLWQADLQAGGFYTSPIFTTAASATRGLPVFTEPVPVGRTKALLTYADASTTLVEGLTPGGTFDYVTPILTANKGRFGASELVSRVWQA